MGLLLTYCDPKSLLINIFVLSVVSWEARVVQRAGEDHCNVKLDQVLDG